MLKDTSYRSNNLILKSQSLLSNELMVASASKQQEEMDKNERDY